ncbi:MAG: DUF1080 domain-containing protein [Isosphaeraceae bacterium]|nr:DUF1080 domain-containing protein [Isosphaeraceae bacterium]
MRWRQWFALGLALAATLAVAPAPADDQGDGTIKLFNGKDLSGWKVYIDPADPKKKGYSPASSTEGIFRVEDGMIHVSGERFAALTTEKEYDNYHLILEFRWGEKKWPPRQNAVRDSGVLLHCVGPDKIWTKSIECQIQEHDCGDFWLVDGTSLTVDGKPQTGGRIVKKKDAEKPTGAWNTIEVICDGSSITNIVNGVVVNQGTNASVTRGRISLQSEGAEVWYRKVELKPLKPAK